MNKIVSFIQKAFDTNSKKISNCKFKNVEFQKNKKQKEYLKSTLFLYDFSDFLFKNNKNLKDFFPFFDN